MGTMASQITSLRVTGLCVGNSPVTGEFPAQMASNVENASIWWRHHVYFCAISYASLSTFLQKRTTYKFPRPQLVVHAVYH